MNNEVIDLASVEEKPRPVQFCGIFRSDEHGAVGEKEAHLLGLILRNAFRKDHDGSGIPEGTLAHYVQRNLSDVDFQVAIKRLVNWKMVVLVVGYGAREGVRVKLTPTGSFHAVNLICGRQVKGLAPEGE
jgi:hypothetical protein